MKTLMTTLVLTLASFSVGAENPRLLTTYVPPVRFVSTPGVFRAGQAISVTVTYTQPAQCAQIDDGLTLKIFDAAKFDQGAGYDTPDLAHATASADPAPQATVVKTTFTGVTVPAGSGSQLFMALFRGCEVNTAFVHYKTTTYIGGINVNLSCARTTRCAYRIIWP